MCAFARLELHRLVRRSQAHFPGPVPGWGVGLQASDTHTPARVQHGRQRWWVDDDSVERNLSTVSREDSNNNLTQIQRFVKPNSHILRYIYIRNYY